MFDLDSYLTTRRQRVDEFMQRKMPPETARPARLHAAMRYSIFGGGKRLRPILALAACEAVGGESARALQPACAIELLHTYTLIHDDLPAMDDDALRRGRPTCHIAFDEATAILAGDSLLTLAFQWLAESEAPPPFSAADYVRELAVAAGSDGVIGGQAEDIAAENLARKKNATAADAELLDYIHAHKTGDLIVAAVRIGAIAGGATKPQLEKLTTSARGRPRVSNRRRHFERDLDGGAPWQGRRHRRRARQADLRFGPRPRRRKTPRRRINFRIRRRTGNFRRPRRAASRARRSRRHAQQLTRIRGRSRRGNHSMTSNDWKLSRRQLPIIGIYAGCLLNGAPRGISSGR